MITATINRKPKITTADQMLVGQLAIITGIGEFAGKPLLRTYDQFVLLTDASQTWESDSFTLNVDILSDGDTVTLTVGNHNLDERILSILRTGLKINAIKKYCEETGEGAVASKRYVDALEQQAIAAGKLSSGVRW